jgi:hypothetical protein
VLSACAKKSPKLLRSIPQHKLLLVVESGDGDSTNGRVAVRLDLLEKPLSVTSSVKRVPYISGSAGVGEMAQIAFGLS